MNSEKVKEIKEALECCKQNEIEETCGYCLVCPASNWDYEKTCTIDLFQKTLTLINELESENERLNKAINSVRKIDEFAECRNCTAWSGTDCTRHPYTQGCLKDENNIKRQAVKEIEEKLKKKSCYIQTAEDNYHVVELSTVYAILKEYEK